MSIASLMTQDVSILYPAFTTDSRGDRVKDWTNATSVNSKAWLAQTATTEVDNNREGTNSEWLLFLPISTSIDNLCRVTFGSLTLEVVGYPLQARTPVETHHQEIKLRIVKG